LRINHTYSSSTQYFTIFKNVCQGRKLVISFLKTLDKVNDKVYNVFDIGF
jgi:hypothetical protein